MNPYAQDYHSMQKQADLTDYVDSFKSRWMLGKHHKSIKDTLQTAGANRLGQEVYNASARTLNQLGSMDRLRLMLSEMMGWLFDKVGLGGHKWYDRGAKIRRDATATVLAAKLGVRKDQITDDWKDRMLGSIENYTSTDSTKDFLTRRIKAKDNPLGKQMIPLIDTEKEIQLAAHKQLVSKTLGGQHMFDKKYAEEGGGEWYRDQLLGENGLAFKPSNAQDPGKSRLFNNQTVEPVQVDGMMGSLNRMFGGGYTPQALPGPTSMKPPVHEPKPAPPHVTTNITNPVGTNLNNSFNSFMNNSGVELGLA